MTFGFTEFVENRFGEVEERIGVTSWKWRTIAELSQTDSLVRNYFMTCDGWNNWCHTNRRLSLRVRVYLLRFCDRAIFRVHYEKKAVFLQEFPLFDSSNDQLLQIFDDQKWQDHGWQNHKAKKLQI